MFTQATSPEAYRHAIKRAHCELRYERNLEHLRRFRDQLPNLDRTEKDTVICLISTQDDFGSQLAHHLGSGGFQMVDLFCGLANRDRMVEALLTFDHETAEVLERWKGLGVVVVDGGVAEVYSL